MTPYANRIGFSRRSKQMAMIDQQIRMLRNDLTLWALGKHPATLAVVQEWIIRLDNLLQQMEL